MILHIFNPGHDEALAAGTPYYTHTRAARLLADNLWELPEIWAKADDLVVAESSIKTANIPWSDIEDIQPWGWDAALVHKLRQAGAPDCLLPSDDALLKIRLLSSRKTTVRLLSLLDTPCKSRWCTTQADVDNAIEQWGDVVVKAPWSSSGRGIIHISGKPTDTQQQRIERIIERQGAMEVEPRYSDFADFALEFRADGQGNIDYEGLSVFSTTPSGGYIGNIVSPALLGAQTFCGVSLSDTISSLTKHLGQILGKDYCGVLGVDAMLIGTNEEIALEKIIINPCVEVNLRHTMGWVALQLSKRMKEGQTGHFAIRSCQPLSQGEIILTPAGQAVQAVLSIEPITKFAGRK